jgi:hypothetical protein
VLAEGRFNRAIATGAVQISPVLYRREGTVDKVVQKIIELGRQGVQFALPGEIGRTLNPLVGR